MFTLTSTDVSNGATAPLDLIDNSAGCKGRNRSPQLHWGTPPPGTRSLAITMHDPDAPRKGGWWHWTLFDLPPSTSGLPAGAGDDAGGYLPAGTIQLINDSRYGGYSGPCPPKGHGTHHYALIVHALKVEHLGLTAEATPQEAQRAIAKQEIATARLMFLYSR